jgi:hypothetical protein
LRRALPLTLGKAPGKKPKLDEKARRLLEGEAQEEPPFTKLRHRQEYLEQVAGVSVSEWTSRGHFGGWASTEKVRWVRVSVRSC